MSARKRKCEHVRRYGEYNPRSQGWKEACSDCGAVLPLGPASIDDRVAIEIRAAELMDIEPWRVQWTDRERIGWAHAPFPELLDDELSAGELAGYLARIMAEYEE